MSSIEKPPSGDEVEIPGQVLGIFRVRDTLTPTGWEGFDPRRHSLTWRQAALFTVVSLLIILEPWRYL